MVATLQRLLVDETGLLEQVDDHVGSRQLTRGVEIDTDELSKPIKELSILLVDFKHITIYLEELSFLKSLCVAPSLKDRVGLDDLVLKGGLALLPLSEGADGGKVGNDLLSVLSDKDGLVVASFGNALVGALGNGKDVWPRGLNEAILFSDFFKSTHH